MGPGRYRVGEVVVAVVGESLLNGQSIVGMMGVEVKDKVNIKEIPTKRRTANVIKIDRRLA